MQSELKTPVIEWQILESLVVSGHLSLVDLELAKTLLKDSLDADVAAFICHLSLAARGGHLCIDIHEGNISPGIYLWNQGHYGEAEIVDDDRTDEVLQQVAAAIARAPEKLPEDLLTSINPGAYENELYAVQTPLCRMGNRYYFQRYWFYETLFLHHYQRFTTIPPKIVLSRDVVADKLLSLDMAKGLLPEQKEAILNACENSLTIICGGPGTGKTHTAGVLICALWDSLNESDREKFEISLAAPTGKAAANLQKSLIKSAKGIHKLSVLQSKTLHALLGVRGSTPILEALPLAADLVIVDESSMIDVRLMAALFARMKPGARLILLGDQHQLPAIEAGSLFSDFVHAQKSSFKVSKLNKCLRAELQSILDVAAAINEGNVETALKLFDQSEGSGVERFVLQSSHQSAAAMARELAAYAFNCYQMLHIDTLKPYELLNHFNRFRMLSPLRRGPFGVEEMNRLISNAYRLALAKRRAFSSTFIAPIMLLKNDYRQELFNGEVGVLVRPQYRQGQLDFELLSGDYALFTAKDGSVRQIPALLLPTFDYAYCLSVHKSQGSEFDHLLLLLPEGSEHFGRELLYTGVTRARRQLTLWGEDEILSAAIQRKNHRLSGIAERLTVACSSV